MGKTQRERENERENEREKEREEGGLMHNMYNRV